MKFVGLAAALAFLTLAGGYLPLIGRTFIKAASPALSLPAPNYDSGWVPINKGQTITLTHGLGISPDQMLVFIYAMDTSAGDGWAMIGVNNNGIGLNVNADGTRTGFDYLNLTSNTIDIFRNDDAAHSDFVRVKIWIHP